MLEEGFELKLEAGLPLDGNFISLGDAFEEDALDPRRAARRV